MTFNDQDRTMSVSSDSNRNLPVPTDSGVHVESEHKVGIGSVTAIFAAMFVLVMGFLFAVNSQREEVARSDASPAETNAQAARDSSPPPAQGEPNAQQRQQQATHEQGQQNPQPSTTGQGGNNSEPRAAQRPQATPQKQPPRTEQPSGSNRNAPQPPQGNTQQ